MYLYAFDSSVCLRYLSSSWRLFCSHSDHQPLYYYYYHHPPLRGTTDTTEQSACLRIPRDKIPPPILYAFPIPSRMRGSIIDNSHSHSNYARDEDIIILYSNYEESFLAEGGAAPTFQPTAKSNRGFNSTSLTFSQCPTLKPLDARN